MTDDPKSRDSEVLQSLTAYEYIGMQSDCSFADGHAYHELSPRYDEVVRGLGSIWESSRGRKVVDSEDEFKLRWAEMLGSETLRAHRNFRICPTSSNSIDILGSYLAASKPRVLFIEPAFDNIYLLLKRRGCAVIPLPETELRRALLDARPEKLLDAGAFDALFLINPNNPTGALIPAELLRSLAEFCRRIGKLLILDTSFRFYANSLHDDYAVLRDSGCSFAVIEDTGKTWPTHDMKASLLAFSDDIAPDCTSSTKRSTCATPASCSTSSPRYSRSLSGTAFSPASSRR